MEPIKEIKDNFVHLHCHSEYSVRDALSKLDDLVKFLKNNNYKYIALTDHGVITGWARLHKAAKENNLIPIYGCEVYVNNYRLINKEEITDDDTKLLYKKYYHLLVIAYNELGIKNLIKINNDAHMNGFYYKPRTDFDTLKKYNEGLIITSACIGGEVPSNIIKGNYDKAKQIALSYKEVFGNRYFLELQVNEINEQKIANEGLINLSKEIDVPLILTNDVHYINKDDVKAHDILIGIRNRSSKKETSEGEDIQGYHARELYYKSYDELHYTWEFYHKSDIFTEDIFVQSCNNIMNVLNLVEKKEWDDEVKLPKMYDDEITVLRKKIDEGLKFRFKDNITQEIKDRIDYEFSILRKMNYIGYFLILEDIISYAKRNNIGTGLGRGSVSGSLIAYVIGLTEVDPIKHKLMFSRFLDLGRDKVYFAKLI